ncbi:hypothetical protein PLEOSDRAFT_169435 [Pleurotus ostreatus PC15]|uniref:Uncharacterized protein n=1 Tax=Pleurotus ostreatus (strain PC15) TaxID=1137138 RepID=A0A067NP49_PLEO1|nr:hypothetical protein PLEOSDRAFT_169435 [Pleurotus ostreatus PC15]
MDTLICAGLAAVSATLLPGRDALFPSFKAAVHAKPGVEPNERQSPKLDRQDSSKSEDQLPPLPADGPESSEHSPPPFDSFNADEKSPPLVNSELTPPAELPPLPDGLELDQPSPRPVDSSGPDDKPPPAELPLLPDGFEPDQPSPPPVNGSGSDDKSPTAELAPPPDGFKPDQLSHRPADSSGSDDKPPPPGKLPPLPDSFESDEESPSVVDSEFTPASDDSSTSQATLIPRGKCNIPSISASPERTPDDMKALDVPLDAVEADTFTEAGPVSPSPNLIQIPLDTYTHLLDQMTRFFSHLHVSPPPALPAAVAPDIQQGCCPQGPDVLRVVESFEASSKAETLERSTHSFLLQEELHGAKRIIANLAETSERCANSNVTSIITRQQAMEIDIATLKQETSSLHDRRTAIVLEDRLDEVSDLRQCLETQVNTPLASINKFQVKERSFALEKQELEGQIAQLNQAQKQAAQQNEQMTRELKYLRRDYETEVQKLGIRNTDIHAEAMHRVELLATENKAIRAQNSEIASIAVNQASKSNIGALQCEGARLQEERSWVGDKVSELISKCAAYEVENAHLHTQVSESISKYAAYEMEIGRIRTEVSDSSSKCAAYEVQNARLHTQACAQDHRGHLPSKVSHAPVAAQTEGIFIVTREAGTQAGGSSDAPPRVTPTTLDQVVQTDEILVISSEAEVQAGGSSDAPLRVPSTDHGVQTDEIVSSEAKARAGGSNNTHQVQSPEGVQAEVTQSETETYGDQSSDSSIQSPPSVDTSHDEEAPSQEIHVVSGEQEYGSDDAAPQLLSTSSELPIFEAHGPDGSPVRRNVRVKQLASTSTSSRRTQSGTRSISNDQNSGQLPKASTIMSPRRTRSSMRLTSNNRICNQLAPGGSLTSKRKATSNSSAAPKKRRRTGFAASGLQRRLATPEELLCDDFKNTFISDLMEEGDTEMPGSYPATPFASSHNQKAVNNPDPTIDRFAEATTTTQQQEAGHLHLPPATMSPTVVKPEVANRSASGHHTLSNICDSQSQTAPRVSFARTQPRAPYDQAAQSTTYHVPPGQWMPPNATHDQPEMVDTPGSPPDLHQYRTPIKFHAHSPPPPEREYITILPQNDSISGHGLSEQRIYHSQTPRRSTPQAESLIESDLHQCSTSTKSYAHSSRPEREYITIPPPIDSISGHGLLGQRIYLPQVASGISPQTPRGSIPQVGSLVETDHRWIPQIEAVINHSAPLNATSHPARAPPPSSYFIDKDMKVFYTEQGTDKLLGRLKLYNADSKSTSDRKPRYIDCVRLGEGLLDFPLVPESWLLLPGDMFLLHSDDKNMMAERMWLQDKHETWQDITHQWNLRNGINNMLVPHPNEKDAYLTWGRGDRPNWVKGETMKNKAKT